MKKTASEGPKHTLVTVYTREQYHILFSFVLGVTSIILPSMLQVYRRVHNLLIEGIWAVP